MRIERELGRLLTGRKESLAVAESCTGGLVAKKITDAPGSSAYFLEAAVTYTNESKERALGVRRATLRKFGAVSAQAAEEMAEGIRRRARSDWGLAATGIAGPSGGSREKPVGTVCFAVAGKGKTLSWARRFSGGREEVREKAALAALDLARRRVRLESISPRGGGRRSRSWTARARAGIPR